TNVNDDNLDAVNTAVAEARTTKGSNLTKAEIQSEVDGVLAAMAAINASNATLQDYEAAGITGVNDDNLDDVNTAVADAISTKRADLTKAEIQSEVDGVLAAWAAAALEETAIAAINTGNATLQNYTDAGITGVTKDNLGAVNAGVAAIKATKGSDLTKEDIQNVVNNF
ncbi:MAG: hypothetical protein KBA53_10615, partial [Thermoclostridium sp.]|nr:hypothetical protein [Thermoclostridium sp.]